MRGYRGANCRTSNPNFAFAAMRYPEVIWSGYQLDQQSFERFTMALLPDNVTPPDTQFVTLLIYYDWWVDQLPKRIGEKAPETCCAWSTPSAHFQSFAYPTSLFQTVSPERI